MIPHTQHTLYNTHTHTTSGHHLEERGEHDEAATHYKKAIKIDMEHGPALSNYANLLWSHFQVCVAVCVALCVAVRVAVCVA